MVHLHRMHGSRGRANPFSSYRRRVSDSRRAPAPARITLGRTSTSAEALPRVRVPNTFTELATPRAELTRSLLLPQSTSPRVRSIIVAPVQRLSRSSSSPATLDTAGRTRRPTRSSSTTTSPSRVSPLSRSVRLRKLTPRCASPSDIWMGSVNQESASVITLTDDTSFEGAGYLTFAYEYDPGAEGTPLSTLLRRQQNHALNLLYRSHHLGGQQHT